MEEAEGLESGSTGAEAAGASGVDPVAVALALNGASREEADAFLRKQQALAEKQCSLIDLQKHHLHEQFKHLHLSVWEKRLGVLLRVATAVVGIAVAASITVMVWRASQADGTVIDAFSVPPQFAQAGITGEVVADDLTSRIGAIRNFAVKNSLSNSRDVRKDSAEDIKVEIPETGVSLGQAWRSLRLWLGHERHLSGNLRLIGEGKIALAVALDGEQAVSISGNPDNLDMLEQQAAEQLFASVDPTNIVLYLLAEGRDTEALAAAERGTQVAAGPIERANAYSLWSGMTRVVTGDMKLALSRAHIAADSNPKLITTQLEMMTASALMGHDEEALGHAQAIRDFREEDQPAILHGAGFAQIVAGSRFVRDVALGDFAQAASEDACIRCALALQLATRADLAARAHDGAASRSLAGQAAAGPIVILAGRSRSEFGFDIARARYFSDANMEDWPAAVTSARVYEANISANPATSRGLKAAILRTQVAPLLAYALARNGDPGRAQEVINATPGDCYDCIRTRGLIAATAKEWGRADYWFARAVHDAPSIPFAYTNWGQALLARGQPDEAIVQFTLANQKGPHFADPLEGWGEALMAKNQSHLALSKFAEAEKYAPNWGRLHMKWGEALLYAGKKDEARAQYQKASTLDLTAADKAELARASGHG